MTDSELFTNESEDNTLASKYAEWDKEALLKKAIAADNHIKTLEEEARNYKEDSKTEQTLQEVLKRLDNTYNASTNYTPTEEYQPSEQPSSGDQVSKEDILNLVNTSIEKKQKESLAKANVEKIRNELKRNWGDTYPQKLSDRAKELGVNQTFLESMAENYPDAFLNLVLPKSDSSNPNVHVPPSNTRSTSSFSNTEGETYKSFKKMEQENPRLRHDPAFQRRKLNAAERLGDAFYN